ncbi:hypothetical protein [Bradyrhizobium vignae]|uniref:hypothetical protein n=1 Tax=Bradyrhizobium vignae TaxID=1549949 RepID=UPI00100B1CA6|nr:hypothetical protein [Bradyrhizobium vignae]RXH02801.1 hypothetical protein EAV90_15295 [Bradyrhizobium vignae]
MAFHIFRREAVYYWRRRTLLAPLPEIVPAGAVDERRRLKDRLRAVDGELAPLVAGALVLAAALCAQFGQIDAFQALHTARDGVVEDLAEEGRMAIERAATDPTLGLHDGSPLLAKLLDRQLLVPRRLAVVLVDVETQEIDELPDVLLTQQAEIENALILDHELDEQVCDALRLPLGFFVPVLVRVILLDDAVSKLGEVGHRNELRDRGSVDLRWIGGAIHRTIHNR